MSSGYLYYPEYCLILTVRVTSGMVVPNYYASLSGDKSTWGTKSPKSRVNCEGIVLDMNQRFLKYTQLVGCVGLSQGLNAYLLYVASAPRGMALVGQLGTYVVARS